MGTPGLEYRPCGACDCLVFADTGCMHWKPNNGPKKKAGWTKGRSQASIAADAMQAITNYNRVLDNGVSGTIG